MTRNRVPGGRWRRIAGAAAAALLACAVPLLGYAGAGVAGGMIPANRDWRAAEQGIRIYVEDNGIHTGIVLPVEAMGIGWDDLVRPGDLRDARYAAYGWRSFGWGERDFFLHTPRWRDLSLRRVIAAGAGSGRTLMHVEAIPEPVAGGGGCVPSRCGPTNIGGWRPISGRVSAPVPTGARRAIPVMAITMPFTMRPDDTARLPPATNGPAPRCAMRG